ncbi:MAG TPA: Os1348 family NHLP clan protein [Gemmatimonadaceae bacterium]|nr:Os1348 family NHLP clan protein [Gemmatimonadaceae bacterium]
MDFQQLVTKILNDAGFRAAVQKDPEAALKQNGVANPSPQMVSALKNFDWNSARTVAQAFAGKTGMIT